MKSKLKLLVVVSLSCSSLWFGACAAPESGTSNQEDPLTGKDASAEDALSQPAPSIAQAVERILTLAPRGFYAGQSPSGAACHFQVSADEPDQVSMDVGNSGLRETRLSFAVHPERYSFGRTRRATEITNWEDNADSLSFVVKFPTDQLPVEAKVEIKDFSKPNGAVEISYLESGSTVRCENVVRSP